MLPDMTHMEPLLILPARLGWRLDRTFIYGDGGERPPTEQELKFIPALECGLDMAGEYGDIVLDPLTLLESAKRPGGYFLLTCECGYADDADIHEQIFVQHPSPEQIVWGVDVQGLRSALVKETWLTHQDGYVRLVFERAQYESDLRRMVADAQEENTKMELYGIAGRGDYGFVERVLAFDFAAPFVSEPVLPPGSHLEFRVEEDEYCWLGGKNLRGWPPHYLPCWNANRAFRTWTQHFERGYAGHPNHFYFRSEAEREACDAAGRKMVEVIQHCLETGSFLPGGTVSFGASRVPVMSGE